MVWLAYAIVIMVFLAVMLVAGNNLSACVAPAIGARIVSKRFGILVGAIGFTAGLLIQGTAMTQSIKILLPNLTPLLQAEALAVSIVIFLVALLIRVPMSLNMALVGLLAGFSVAGGTRTDFSYLTEVVSTWVLVPVAAFALAFGLVRLLNRGWPKNFWHRLQAYKVLLVVASFSTAYVTGANTLGLIVAAGGFDWATVLAAVAAIFIGCFFLSEGAIRRVSKEFFVMRYVNATVTLVSSTLLVEFATILSIPLSITQTTSTAVFGTGLSYRTKFVSAKPFLIIAAGWIIAPLLSFAIGLLIG